MRHLLRGSPVLTLDLPEPLRVRLLHHARQARCTPEALATALIERGLQPPEAPATVDRTVPGDRRLLNGGRHLL